MLALRETKLGIIPGAGGTYRLPAIIGQTHAMDLILTGRRVFPGEAFRLGLATRYFPTLADGNPVLRDRLREEGIESAYDPAIFGAVELMREICSGGPLAVRAAKEAVKAWKRGGTVENQAYEKVVQTRDRDEALRAFRDKRKPEFTGE